MKFNRKLGVPVIPPAEDEADTTYTRIAKAKAKHQRRQQLRSKWESKALHAQLPTKGETGRLGPRQYQQTAKATGLKAETEGFIIAAQDQSLPTRWYQHNILKKDEHHSSSSKPRQIGLNFLGNPYP